MINKTDNSLMLVSDEQIKTFKRNGAVVLRGIFKDWVNTRIIDDSDFIPQIST